MASWKYEVEYDHELKLYVISDRQSAAGSRFKTAAEAYAESDRLNDLYNGGYREPAEGRYKDELDKP